MVPRILAVSPSRSVAIEEKPVPGPKRQSASTDFGVKDGPVMAEIAWQAVKAMDRMAAVQTSRINDLERRNIRLIQSLP